MNNFKIKAKHYALLSDSAKQVLADINEALREIEKDTRFGCKIGAVDFDSDDGGLFYASAAQRDRLDIILCFRGMR